MPQRGVYFLKAMFIRYYNFFSTGWQELFLNRQLEKKTTMRKKNKVDAETAAVGRFQNDSPPSPLSVV
jgi:hypothetical protein